MSENADHISLAELIEPTVVHTNATDQPVDDEYEYEYSSSEYDSDGDDHSIDLRSAQLQWEHSVQQIKTLVSIVILPLIGKVLGRRFAGYIWRKAFDFLY